MLLFLYEEYVSQFSYIKHIYYYCISSDSCPPVGSFLFVVCSLLPLCGVVVAFSLTHHRLLFSRPLRHPHQALPTTDTNNHPYIHVLCNVVYRGLVGSIASGRDLAQQRTQLVQLDHLLRLILFLLFSSISPLCATGTENNLTSRTVVVAPLNHIVCVRLNQV